MCPNLKLTRLRKGNLTVNVEESKFCLKELKHTLARTEPKLKTLTFNKACKACNNLNNCSALFANNLTTEL